MDLNHWPWMYKIPALTSWAKWVFKKGLGLLWVSFTGSYADFPFPFFGCLMSRLELLTISLWEKLSVIEIHQNIVGIQGIEPWLLFYQNSFLTIRRYANIAGTEWLEHSSFRFGVWGFTIKLSAINGVISLTSNYSKEGLSKSSTSWKHENIVWTLWDLNSSKTLQMFCANLITLQSPLVWVLELEPRTTGFQSQHSTTKLHPYIAESSVLETHTLLRYTLLSR